MVAAAVNLSPSAAGTLWVRRVYRMQMARSVIVLVPSRKQVSLVLLGPSIFRYRLSRSLVRRASSCSCCAILSAVLLSSPAPEKAAACSTRSLMFWRIMAIR